MNLTLVTAASSNHYQPLLNLLASIRQWEPQTCTIVWDIGLTDAEAFQVRRALPAQAAYKRFPFHRHPPHLRELQPCGWKPLVIHWARPGPILWLDAGNLLMGKLDRIRVEIAERGLYTPASAGNLTRWVHPETLRRMDVPVKLAKLQTMRAGTLVGLGTGPAEELLSKEWLLRCLEPETLMPAGADRSNHRHDQAILSVLAYRHPSAPWLADALLGVAIHNDRLTAEEAALKCGISF